MASWTDSVVILAPANRVFAYVDEPMRLPDWLPGMIEIRNVIGTGAGQQFEWTYKMAGLLLRGQATVVEHVPHRCAVHQSIGTVSSTFGYFVTSPREGTRLTLEIEYSMPLPVLDKWAAQLAVKRNAREFDMALANVKEALEA